MTNIAKKLKYMGYVYEYSHSKDNILIYTLDPKHHFYDWEEDGGILVVKYRPEINGEKNKYVVLHKIVVFCNGTISPSNISGMDRNPEIVDE